LKGQLGWKSWEDLVTEEVPEAEFLLSPYIPKEGKVFMFGGTSIGKSPLCWTIAFCIAEGVPFFGLPTKKTEVLFIELDSTETSTRRRLKKFPSEPPKGVKFLFLKGLNVAAPHRAHMEVIQRAIQEFNPGLIVVNTLRKAHSMDDKSSDTVKIVYDWFDLMFPGKAILFVHHEKKAIVDPEARAGQVDREKFSGSAAWMNDAQVGLHLRGKAPLELWHVKSQETELYRPLPLSLAKDGTTLSCPAFQEHQTIQAFLEENPSMLAREQDWKLSKLLNVSVRTAQRRKAQYRSGDWSMEKFLTAEAAPEDANLDAPGENERRG
jgi:hypothetical protein